MEKTTRKNRVLAIDLARGISVILMVLVHTLLVYGDHDTRHHSSLGTVVGVLGQGAPMFLISMGISFVFSRNTTLISCTQRGLFVLGIGYLMNLLKFVVPITLFGGLPVPFVEAYQLPYGATSNIFFFLLLGDILQLAGFTLLLMGLIIHFTRNKYVPLVISVLIIAFSRELSGLRAGLPILDYFCDIMWGNQFNVYFPMFPWAGFILLGLFFGLWYKQEGASQIFLFNRMFWVVVGLSVAGVLLCILNYRYHFGDFYHLGPGGTFALMGITLMVLCLCHQLTKRIRQNIVFDFIFYCSKNVTAIYFVQWVLINWGMYVFGFWSHQEIGVMSLMGLFLLVSLSLVYLFGILNKYSKKRRLKLALKA